MSTHYRCRFRQRENAERMLAQLRRLLGNSLVADPHIHQAADGYHLLEFDKVLPRTSGSLNHLLEGGLVYD